MTKPFSAFYNRIANKSEARRRAQKIRSLVRKHHPQARTILELGCGNGNVLAAMPAKYILYALDIEPDFIKLAKRKVPRAHVLVASMDDFELGAQVDVAYATFFPMNYLGTFQSWERTFEAVERHLNPGGLYVFDSYTPQELRKERNGKPRFWKEPFGFGLDEGIVQGNRLTWDFKLFERIGTNRYELHQYYFRTRIFPVRRVETALTKRFRILEKLDNKTLRRPTKTTTELLYAARKRPHL